MLDPIELFFERFKDHLDTDDFMQYFAKRTAKQGETFLNMRTYRAEKLSKVVLEDYVIRGKLNGKIIIAYPSTVYTVPMFFFQLGGSTPEKTLAVLDISPTLPDVDFSPIKPVYEKYSRLLAIEPTKISWLASITSPYLLHCAYKALDRELFIDAMLAYFNTWYQSYYLKAQRINDKKKIKAITKSIYTFKHVLHHNDPAYGIYVRAWGKPVADAYIHLEYGDHPALLPPKKFKTDIKIWENKKLGIKWTIEAQERVMEAPKIVHPIIRKAVEKNVFQANIELITLEVFEKYKEKRPGG